jgi:hypothetical protein
VKANSTKVFLSYSHQDRQQLGILVEALKKAGIEPCMDLEELRGGDLWPQRLGEAIASHSVMLLAWSKHSAASHFVRFEWSTALALNKTIIPVSLDSVGIPPDLSALPFIPLAEPEAIVRAIAKVLAHADQSPASPDLKVVSGLKSIAGGNNEREEKNAVDSALVLYRNLGLIMGDVLAGGNVSITIHSASPALSHSNPSRGLLKRVGTMVGILVGIATLVEILYRNFHRESASPPPPAVSDFRGIVENGGQSPLQGAQVILVINRKPFDTVFTNHLGGFVFDSVPGEAGERIRIYVHSEGYQATNSYYTLPGPVKVVLGAPGIPE